MSDSIPPELIENILLRLPIKDVVRSTSVCKSWYELITSFSFISMHLISSISNTESRVMLNCFTKYYNEQCYLHRDNQGFEEIQELECPDNPDAIIWIHGPSNGVFCCFSGRIINQIYSDRITVWNPSLRKSLILPESKYAQLSKNQKHVFGFGFLPETDNFKVVRVAYTHKSEFELSVPPEIEVYEFLSGSWRDVDALDFSYILNYEGSQALLKGIVHWIARNRVGSKVEGIIVSFDLTSEKYQALMLPKCVKDHQHMLYSSVHTWKESLTLLHRESIFVMKEYGNTDSWEKLLTFDFCELKPLYIRENGEILAKEKEYDELFENLVSWNPKTNKIMDLLGYQDGRYFRQAYAYVDSLFLI